MPRFFTLGAESRLGTHLISPSPSGGRGVNDTASSGCVSSLHPLYSVTAFTVFGLRVGSSASSAASFSSWMCVCRYYLPLSFLRSTMTAR